MSGVSTEAGPSASTALAPGSRPASDLKLPRPGTARAAAPKISEEEAAASLLEKRGPAAAADPLQTSSIRNACHIASKLAASLAGGKAQQEELLAVFSGKSKEQLELIQEAYKQLTGNNLVEDAEKRLALAGRELVSAALKGPEGLAEYERTESSKLLAEAAEYGTKRGRLIAQGPVKAKEVETLDTEFRARLEANAGLLASPERRQALEQQAARAEKTALDKHVGERLAALDPIIRKYAAERGKLLAEPDRDEQRLKQLEAEYQEALKPYADLLQNEKLSQAVQKTVQAEEDAVRAKAAAGHISRMSKDIGCAKAHQLYDSSVEVPRAALDSYLEQQKDLIARHPQLAADLQKTREQGEAAGRAAWGGSYEKASKIYNAMWGGGTDEKAVYDALHRERGESQEDFSRRITALRQAYRLRYDVDLDQRYAGDFEGPELERVRCMMNGDRVGAASAALFVAMKGGGTDEDELKQVLRELSDEEKGAVEAHFNQHYAARYGTHNLEEALKSELSGYDLGSIMAIKNGDKAMETAVAIDEAMRRGFKYIAGTDESAIFGELTKALKEGNLEEVKQKYEAQYGRSLESAMRSELSGLELERALALLSGNKVKADAAGLEYAMHGGLFGWGTDEKEIQAILRDTSDDHRRAVTAEYNASYGQHSGQDLSAAFKDEMSNHDLQMAQALAERGKLTDAETVRDCIVGAGTDEERLLKVLRGKSGDEIRAVADEYRRKFNSSMYQDIKAELSGDDWFDAAESMRGQPRTLKEMLERDERRAAHERSGMFSGMIDWFSKEGEVMDRDLKRTREYAASIDPNNPTVEQRRNMETLTEGNRANADGFRASKNSVTDGAVMVGTTTAAVVTTVGTLGAGAPLWAAALATAGAIGGSNVLIKGGLKGAGYGWEEAAVDAGMAGVSGATVFIGGAAGTKAADAALRRLAVGYLTRTGAEVTEEAVKKTSEELLKRGVVRFGVAAVQNATDGLLSGSIEGGAGTAMADGLWKDGLLPGLRHLATGMVFSGGTGGGAGTGLGSVFQGAGEAIRRRVAGRAGAEVHASTPHTGGPGPDAAPAVQPGRPQPGADPGTAAADLRPSAPKPPGELDPEDQLFHDIYDGDHPSIEGSRNAGMVQPGEAELVGAGVQSTPPHHLGAAHDGPAYDAGSGRRRPDTRMSADKDPANTPGSGSGSGGSGDDAVVHGQGRGTHHVDPGITQSEIEDLIRTVESGHPNAKQIEELAYRDAAMTPAQRAKLSPQTQRGLEAAALTYELGVTGQAAEDLYGNLVRLSLSGHSMTEVGDMLRRSGINQGAALEHVGKLADLAERNVPGLKTLLEPSDLNRKVADTLLVDQVLRNDAIKLGNLSDAVVTVRARSLADEALALPHLQAYAPHRDVLIGAVKQLLKNPHMGEVFTEEAIRDILKARSTSGFAFIVHSAHLDAANSGPATHHFEEYLTNMWATVTKGIKAGQTSPVSWAETDMQRTFQLHRKSQDLMPSVPRPGTKKTPGQINEDRWQQSFQLDDRKAFTAGDAIEYICKKHGRAIPQGKQIPGLEKGVDLAVLRSQVPGMDSWEGGDYMLIQLKSSPKDAIKFIRDNSGDFTPVITGPAPQPRIPPGVTEDQANKIRARAMASVLDNLDTDFRYPLSWTHPSPEGIELGRLADQAKASGVPRRVREPLWVRAYLRGDAKAEEDFLRQIDENLTRTP